MNFDTQSYKSGAVNPMACVRDGWQLIKNDYWFFLGLTFAGLMLGSLAQLFLLGPAMCGIHYCLLRQGRGQRVAFDMLFRGFDYFVPSLVATLLMAIPMMVLVLAIVGLFMVGIFSTLAAMPRPAPGEPVGPEFVTAFVGMTALYVVAIMLISIVPKVLFFFTYPLIVDRGLSGVEAIKLSMRAVFGNLFGVVGVVFLADLLSLVGFAFCYVGAILVLPLTFAMMAIAYQQVFAREERDLDLPASERYLVGPVETSIQSTDPPAAEPGSGNVTA